MREYQEKKKIRKVIYSKWVFFLLGLVLVFLVFSVVKVYLGGRGASAKREEINKNLEAAEKRKSELEAEIARLESASGAEEEIRKRFNVARPGEKVLVILDKPAENVKIDGESGAGFFAKIWQTVKSVF